MQDLCYQMDAPCVMDIKMGTKTAGENANVIKRAHMQSRDKSTTTSSLGVRLTACRVFNSVKQDYTELSRSDAANINSINLLKEHLKNFFWNGSDLRLDVLEYYEDKLKRLYRNWMKDQSTHRFYSSSLLFTYDGIQNLQQTYTRCL